MSRKALKAINWSAITERIPSSEKAALTAFKSKSDRYLQRMMTYPEDLPKIDWTYYKKTIVTPGLVDKFYKEYEAISVPYPTDKYTEAIDNEQKEIANKIQSFTQQVNSQIAELQQSLDQIKNMIPFSEMTMEDFSDINPEESLRPDRESTTWPHTEDSQEKFDEKNDPKDKDNH
ncbi:ATP synthase subunit d, mitochondrial-like [Apis laboriosa]|uniref:ATP synthase subunit d, mitochondrial-like n=1 Tax=Apis laboriosa TaxID=183418 RepID=UPI001CC62BA4|nr:ATP synthase subunit d, mitochondrial-like [Apis laboriosa]